MRIDGQAVLFRYRTGWGGCMVLQALIRNVTGPIAIPQELGGGYGYWRDAQAGDISTGPDPLPKTMEENKK